jgi:DNA repair exonuclease SbcCD ATPase subunit
MSITFNAVRWKNFLSTGNTFTEIQLDQVSTTLIVGGNGAGKSTMLDALSFGLFGKPYRNINKPQLINSINNKDCKVEVEFTVGPNRYKVVRGMKPQMFEIHRNGELFNETSHAREFQKMLEQNILKLNHKSFHQIVVLGSSSFVPFMQLSASQRREVIEDLLDINIFSKMNGILKEGIAVIRDKINDKNHQVDLVRSKIEMQRKYIRDIKNLNEEKIREKQTEITAQEDTIVQVNAENEKIQEALQTTYDKTDELLRVAAESANMARGEASGLKKEISTLVKESKFFDENDVCPTCTQQITEDIKHEKKTEIAKKAEEVQSSYQKVNNDLKTYEEQIKKLTDESYEQQALSSELNQNNLKISWAHEAIAKLEKEITQISGTKTNIVEATTELDSYIDQKDTLITEKMELDQEHDYSKAMMEMLKDTGIKTKIIRQYLPVMNKYINNYLQTLDFFVHFELDEAFNETIRSRHRDNFSYDSFSEGEKQRIDLALLFTWRQIARMKNSVATNLLVLDETFDSSLDNDGIENLFKIIYSLGETANVFVISHKGEILDNRFKHKIEFYKDKNFSKIK